MPNKTLRCGTARLCVALLLMSGSVAGCERVVSVTLPTSAPRLVVEARLERIRGKVSGNQEIRLSATDDYFSRSAPPAVTNATVRVADSTGRVYAFIPSPSTPGSYVASGLTIVTGARYTLRITWQGDEYEATERAMAGVPIDSLYFKAASEQGSILGPAPTGGGLRATFDVIDPKGIANFYLWDQFVDGKRTVTTDTTSFGFYRAAFSDEFIDGGTLKDLQPYGGVTVRSGQLVLIRQLAISAQAYRFYNSLSTQAINDGSPFSVQPTSVRGNVANRTRPSQLALGYFIVGEVTEVQARVP